MSPGYYWLFNLNYLSAANNLCRVPRKATVLVVFWVPLSQMTYTPPNSKPKYDVWRQVNCVGRGSPLKKKQACQRQSSVKTSDFLSTMQQWNSTKTLKYLVVVFDPVAAVGGKQEENERRPKSGATSATTWHQVQGPPWLLCQMFCGLFLSQISLVGWSIKDCVPLSKCERRLKSGSS